MNNILLSRQCCPICNDAGSVCLYTEKYNSESLRAYFHHFYEPQGYPAAHKLSNFKFELLECIACGFIYQKHIPNSDFMQELYSVWIDEDKATEKYELYRSEFKLIENSMLLLSVIKYHARRDLKIYDYGFGYCHLLRQGLLFGMSCYGTEQNPKQIEYAKQLGVSVFDLNDGKHPKMDVVFCEQVLEHVSDPILVVRNILRLCDEHTLVHISTPNAKYLKKVIKNFQWVVGNDRNKLTMPFAPLEHINCFTYENLIYLMVQNGFKLIEIDEFKVIKTSSKNIFQLLNKIFFFLKSYYKYIFKLKNSTDLFFKLSTT